MLQARPDSEMNESHDPGNAEELVLRAFKHDREEYGESRMTPQLIRVRLTDDEITSQWDDFDELPEASKGNVSYALSHLTTAGWVEKIGDGLYEFVDDPRDADDS